MGQRVQFSHRWDLQPDSMRREGFLFAVTTPILKTCFRICFSFLCASRQVKNPYPLSSDIHRNHFSAHSFSSSKHAAANVHWNLPFPFHFAPTERCSSCCRWLIQLLRGLVDDLFCRRGPEGSGGNTGTRRVCVFAFELFQPINTDHKGNRK